MSDSRYRDFDAAMAERRAKPLRFRLAGEEFSVPLIGFLDFAEFAEAQQAGGVTTLRGVASFLRAVVPEPEHERLESALRRIDLIAAQELASFLVGAATGAPLAEPSASSSPRSRPGRRPKLVSLPDTSTPSSSASAAS